MPINWYRGGPEMLAEGMREQRKLKALGTTVGAAAGLLGPKGLYGSMEHNRESRQNDLAEYTEAAYEHAGVTGGPPPMKMSDRVLAGDQLSETGMQGAETKAMDDASRNTAPIVHPGESGGAGTGRPNTMSGPGDIAVNLSAVNVMGTGAGGTDPAPTINSELITRGNPPQPEQEQSLEGEIERLMSEGPNPGDETGLMRGIRGVGSMFGLMKPTGDGPSMQQRTAQLKGQLAARGQRERAMELMSRMAGKIQDPQSAVRGHMPWAVAGQTETGPADAWAPVSSKMSKTVAMWSLAQKIARSEGVEMDETHMSKAARAMSSKDFRPQRPHKEPTGYTDTETFTDDEGKPTDEFSATGSSKTRTYEKDQPKGSQGSSVDVKMNQAAPWKPGNKIGHPSLFYTD